MLTSKALWKTAWSFLKTNKQTNKKTLKNATAFLPSDPPPGNSSQEPQKTNPKEDAHLRVQSSSLRNSRDPETAHYEQVHRYRWAPKS